MLSAAAAALLASPWTQASADTSITTSVKAPVSTAAGGNISIASGGSVDIATSSVAAVLINSNATLTNQGSISNSGVDSAIGLEIDTTGGNIIAPGTLINNGNMSLIGKGTGKLGVLVAGANTYFGTIDFVTLPNTTTASALTIKGDTSSAFELVQFTQIDGDLILGGTISMTPSDKSTAVAASAVDLEGNLNGNFVVASGGIISNVGNSARGISVLGPIGTCDTAAMAAHSLTCNAGSVGAFIVNGTISVTGTTTPNVKGGNVESGSTLVVANGIYGGIEVTGPQTANANITTGVIAGNGAILRGSASPVVLIDPGQSVTSTQTFVRGPLVMGPVSSLIDSADGVSGQVGGYSFINHGTIAARPIDSDVSSATIVIQGSSATNYTCLGNPAASAAAGACVTTAIVTPAVTTTTVTNGTVTTTTNGVTTTTTGPITTTTVVTPAVTTVTGGLLNTGTIVAQAVTAENTTSGVTATALSIGAYATVPRIVVAGELTTGANSTPGSIAAQVSGPGGGNAAGIVIGSLAVVPEIDVLARGSISASISTTTFSPTSVFANSSSPFSQASSAIVDQSGSLKTVNNAGSILALNTLQAPGAGAVVHSTSHAIDTLANTAGGTTINNSGTIEGDIYFGAAGNGDTLNVGNVGAAGTANTATGVINTPYAYATVSQRILSQTAGLAPVTNPNTISFGSGSSQTLHVGGFGFVNSVILAQAGGLNVTVDPNGQLFVANTAVTGSLFSNNFVINGGVLGLNITQGTSTSTPVVQANAATIAPNSTIGLQFGGYISAGTTAASVAHPTPQVITLISAGSLTISSATLAAQNAQLTPVIPFLFETPAEAGSSAPKPLSVGTSGSNQTLQLTLIPRAPGAKNADGTAGLGLSGDAINLFPFTAAALANDPALGAAIATNLTVTNGVGTTTLNVAASQQKAQQIFSQFTPDVSGGTRELAIMLTDQATGPVAARQRLLRSYGNGTGELTLWSAEFAGMINNKGRVDADGTLTDYKSHGWGFTMGMDAGSARGGWYGGAITYYSGDVSETLPRQSLTHEQWYLLTGYTDWRGKHVFLDTALNLSYASLLGNRGLNIGDQVRDAVGKRPALSGSGGVNMGAIFNYGALQLVPHFALDALMMREEGYSETSGGDGLNLQLAPYYSNSLRAFLGSDFKGNFDVWGIDLSPEARLGYRYDLANSPVKLKGGFLSTGGISTPGNVVTFVGPDPDSGTAVVGGSLSAGTDTWSVGANYDWLRGNNGSTTQVGVITLLGRI